MKFKFLVTIDVDINANELRQLKITKENLSELLIEEINVSGVVPFNTEGDVIFVNGADFEAVER